MDKSVQIFKRRTGSKIIELTCPSDMDKYQKYMGGVDKSDQHHVMGAEFSNLAHFKKCYKKAFLGIADFSILQAYAALNLSVNQLTSGSQGGTPKRQCQ